MPTSNTKTEKKLTKKWIMEFEVPSDWTMEAFAGSLKGFFVYLKIVSLKERR